MKSFVLSLVFLVGLGSVARAQKIRIAVAANAQFVMKTLCADFNKKTGIETEIISGSSGKLTAQIKNGAPYDLFLSADMDLPTDLYKSGFALTPPKIYALGSLIVCGLADLDIKNWKRLLQAKSDDKIAIANPVLAPYGKAAEEALHTYKLWDNVQSKLVLGESIAQVNTYLTTGVVSLGFTTESFIHENLDTKLKWMRIDTQVYSPIQQGMVVLSYSKKGNYASAMKFFGYLSSPAAKQLLKQNGYRIP